MHSNSKRESIVLEYSVTIVPSEVPLVDYSTTNVSETEDAAWFGARVRPSPSSRRRAGFRTVREVDARAVRRARSATG